jgi:hypothetical protein
MLGIFIVILPGKVLMFILLLMCLSIDISKEMDEGCFQVLLSQIKLTVLALYKKDKDKK